MTIHRPIRRYMVAGLGVVMAATLVGAGTDAYAQTPGQARSAGANPAAKGTLGPAPRGVGVGKGAASSVPIKDSYIVVLKDQTANAATVQSQSASLVGRFGGSVTRQLSSSAVHGFAAHMTSAQAKAIASDSRVASVVPNEMLRLSATQSNPPTWGLDRIDQTYLPLNKSYNYPTDGTGVHVYVLDTGIRATNVHFGGRVDTADGQDFVNPGTTADDPTFSDPECAQVSNPPLDTTDNETGHGTHVAGIIGSDAYGVAKGVTLVPIRVARCDGLVPGDALLAGIGWVTDHAVKPAVANLSLSGWVSDDPALASEINTAISGSIDKGVSYVVAAGNDAHDACENWPANLAPAITVGASAITDFTADFSNTGPCVDVFAPGVNITSTFNTSDTATATMGGTSMATPYVTGAAALLLAANPDLTPAQVQDQITNNSVKQELRGYLEDTPNRLLNVNGTNISNTISLMSEANLLYVTADSSGKSPLIANRLLNQGWETFDVVPQSDGLVALRAHSNNKYVTAENGGKSPLIANRDTVGSWEKFTLIRNSDGSISLKANANGKYVTAENGGDSPLIANRTSIGSWERFDPQGPAAVVNMKAYINGKFVTAENGGKSSLIANRSTAGSWESFDLVDLGGGWVSLRAHANGDYVTAENGGKSPLIANRTSVGSWEAFYLSSDGVYSALYANADEKWVTADNAGKSPLIANRDDAGSWQSFLVSE